MSDDKIKLKPCPSCGSEDLMSGAILDGRKCICCWECGFFVGFYKTLDEAKEEWNRKGLNEMHPCKKCAHEKICRYCGIETSGCPHYLAAENNWIPFGFDEDGMLTGRLPEEDEEILVINKYGYIHKDKWCVDANGEYYLDSGWILVDYATAWMPLPEPYKPEE